MQEIEVSVFFSYFSSDSCHCLVISGDHMDQIKQLEHLIQRSIIFKHQTKTRKGFIFFQIIRPNIGSETDLLFWMTSSTSENTITPFSPRTLASSLSKLNENPSKIKPQNLIFKQNSRNLSVQLQIRRTTLSKMERNIEIYGTYRRVVSLMEPLRWAWSSILGIGCIHSIFLIGFCLVEKRRESDTVQR